MCSWTAAFVSNWNKPCHVKYVCVSVCINICTCRNGTCTQSYMYVPVCTTHRLTLFIRAEVQSLIVEIQSAISSSMDGATQFKKGDNIVDDILVPIIQSAFLDSNIPYSLSLQVQQWIKYLILVGTPWSMIPWVASNAMLLQLDVWHLTITVEYILFSYHKIFHRACWRTSTVWEFCDIKTVLYS